MMKNFMLLLLIYFPGTGFADTGVYDELLKTFNPGTKLRGFYDIKSVGVKENTARLWNIPGVNGCEVDVDSRNDKNDFIVIIKSGGEDGPYSTFNINSPDYQMDPYLIEKKVLSDGTIKYTATRKYNLKKSILFIKGKQVAIISSESYGAANKILVCGGI